MKKTYTNFVRASADDQYQDNNVIKLSTTISGEEARRIYLEEINTKNSSEKQNKLSQSSCRNNSVNTKNQNKLSQSVEKFVKLPPELSLSNKDLFLTVQNNDVETLRYVLDQSPDRINTVDDYNWSLLMIACQSNSIETVKELLKRGIDISIRDKAGNSARSLVIKNKNYQLANIFLNYTYDDQIKKKSNTNLVTQEFSCEICNKPFPDKDLHLSSTIHNISASKGRKIPTSYAIPQCNRGFQMMLKVGWDKDSGLGRDGTGKKYPIKVVKKEDRKGLGHEKRKRETQTIEDNVKHKNKRKSANECFRNRRFEINFRREFY